jgi:hypothetical protein
MSPSRIGALSWEDWEERLALSAFCFWLLPCPCRHKPESGGATYGFRGWIEILPRRHRQGAQ